MIKVELTDREAALIVRSLRHAARVLDEICADDNADELRKVADRLNALKILAGGAAG